MFLIAQHKSRERTISSESHPSRLNHKRSLDNYFRLSLHDGLRMRCSHACDAKCTIDGLHLCNTGIVPPRFPSILRFNAVKVLTRGKSQVEWHENQKRQMRLTPNIQSSMQRVPRRMSFTCRAR